MGQKIDEKYKKVIKIYVIIMFLLILFLPMFPIMLIFGLWGLMTEFYISLGIFLGIPLLIFFILAPTWANKLYENYSFELEIEDIRINSGIFTKNQKSIPYRQIENLKIKSNFIERRCGLSTILIETAGHLDGENTPPEGVIPGLRDPESIVKEIRSRMEKFS